VTSLGEALNALAAAAPDRPAITHEGRTITRAELERRTNRLARAYADLGVRAGDFVTIALPNGGEFFEATLATWKLGAVPQPVSARLPELELDAILELANPALLVGIESGGRPSVPPGFEPPASCSADPLPPAVSPSLKAPTSGGSTGRPKLIVSTAPGEVEALEPLAGLLGMTRDGVHLSTSPLSHNGPFICAVAALMTGCHVVVMTRFRAEEALALIERHRVDWWYLVPTLMQRVWQLPPEQREAHDVSSLRVVMHMAAPCPPWLKQAWIDWLGPERILELYGATEMQAVTVIDGREWLERPGSVGRAVLGEIAIRDDDFKPVPAGTVGEVWMRRGEGEEMPYRYIGAEPEERDGWETVGDMGRLDEVGYLFLADRRADMILVGGANVYPAEIESALDEHPAVASSCVIGLPDDDLGSVPHAIVQPANGHVDEQDLLAHLQARLEKKKLPRTFEYVDEPLRDDAGKVRRAALRAERL
jgi:bile acid-coenzyme A ligase